MFYILKYFIIVLNLILLLPSIYGQKKFLIPTKSTKAQYLITEAKSYEKSGQWEKACNCYKKILKNYPKKLISVAHNRYLNAGQFALQSILKIPHLKLQDKQILSNHDTVQLQDLCTKQGMYRYMHLIEKALFQEEYQKCISYIYFCLNHLKGINKKFDIANYARLGLCYYALEYTSQLHHLLKYINNKDLNCSLKIGDKKLKLSFYLQRLLEQLKNSKKTYDKISEWHMYGKSIQRNFQHSVNINQLNEKWSKLIPEPQRVLKRRYYNERQRIIKNAPSTYPIIANNTIFINNGQSVFAYDLYTSKLKWKFQGLVSQLNSDVKSQIINSITYHDNFLYLNIEGKTPTQMADQWSIYQISKIIPERRLIKLDAENGRLIWTVEDNKKEADTFANKASFMTSPVIWDKNLYVGVAELTGLFNSYVVAVNPVNGKIKWKSLLGSAQQELNMFGRPVKESIGSNITVAHGCLYYLNNLGAVSCTNPTNGYINWIFLYDRIPLSNYTFFKTIYRETSWYNNSVFTYGNKIYFAPLDSKYLYCLDAFTGKEIWKKRRKFDEKYLLAVTKDRVFTGGRCINILDANNGNLIKEIYVHGNVEGLGIVSGKYFYCPCTIEIYCIDIKSLKVEKKIMWSDRKKNHGHIIGNDFAIVSSSDKYLNVFYDLNQLLINLKDKVKKNPQDFSSYLQLAKLYIQKSKNQHNEVKHAIAIYDKMLKNSSIKEYYKKQAKKNLCRLYIDLADKYWNKGTLTTAISYYNKALILTKESAKIINIMKKQIKYYSYFKDHNNFLKTVKKLIRQYGNESLYNNEIHKNELVKNYGLILLAKFYRQNNKPVPALKKFREILLDYPEKKEWATEQIKLLIDKYGQIIYNEYDEEVYKNYTDIKKIKYNSSHLKRMLEQYPNNKYAPDIYIEMSEMMFKKNDITQAIDNLIKMINNHSSSKHLLKAYYLLFKCYEKKKNFLFAKRILNKLKEKYIDKVIIIDSNKINIKEFVSKKLNNEIYSKINIENLAKLNLWEKNNIKYKFQESPSMASLRLIKIFGTPAPEYENFIFFSQASNIICRDGISCKEIWRKSPGWVSSVGFINKSLFAWTANKIIKLDPKTGATIWMADTTYRIFSITLDKGIIAAVCQDYYSDTVIEVRTFESKDITWQIKFNSKKVGDILIGKDSIIVWTKDPSMLKVHDLKTGKVLYELPTIKQNCYYYPVLCNGGNYLCIAKDKKKIECYSLPLMKKSWEYRTSPILTFYDESPMVVAKEDYICFLRKKALIALEVSTGEVKWNYIPPANSIYQLIPKQNIFLYLGKGYDDKYINCIDVRNGKQKWILNIMSRRSTGDIIVTKKYIIILTNNYYRGYKSSVKILDKFKGQEIKIFDINKGNRGYGYAQMAISGNNLWIVKENTIWVFGK